MIDTPIRLNNNCHTKGLLENVLMSSQKTLPCSKSTIETIENILTLKTPEWCYWRCFWCLYCQYWDVSHLFLVFLLLTLGKYFFVVVFSLLLSFENLYVDHYDFHETCNTTMKCEYLEEDTDLNKTAINSAMFSTLTL